jgi:hypothetical protein
MLRHGYLRSPIHWHEVNEVCSFNSLVKLISGADKIQSGFKGVLIIKDQYTDPDVVIYYSHGTTYH